MRDGVDRSEWRARYEAGERTAVLAAEAGISYETARLALVRQGTRMRGPGRAGTLPDLPTYWERLENGYPDEERRDWVRKQAQLWRGRGRP